MISTHTVEPNLRVNAPASFAEFLDACVLDPVARAALHDVEVPADVAAIEGAWRWLNSGDRASIALYSEKFFRGLILLAPVSDKTLGVKLMVDLEAPFLADLLRRAFHGIFAKTPAMSLQLTEPGNDGHVRLMQLLGAREVRGAQADLTTVEISRERFYRNEPAN